MKKEEKKKEIQGTKTSEVRSRNYRRGFHFRVHSLVVLFMV